MKITQKELARLAGVSQQTVNRALAQHPDVSPKTRREISRLAEKYGYRPNSAAQAMRTGRYDCVLLLMSTNRGKSYLPVELLDGIHDGLAAHDQRLMVANLDDEALNSDTILPSVLRRWLADGVIINYTHFLPPRLGTLIETYRLPAVWVNVKHATDSVCPDDWGGGLAATQRLITLGHKRIMFVNTMSEGHYSAIDRRLGYEQAMHDAGLEPAWLLVKDRYPGAAERRELLRPLFAQSPLPTAIVTNRPEDALTIKILALMRGLRIPEQLSLISFAEGVEDRDGLALSVMLLPEREMGQAAVDLLRRKIAADSAAQPSLLVPLQAFAGETLAPCPK